MFEQTCGLGAYDGAGNAEHPLLAVI